MIDLNTNPKQAEFANALFSGEYNFLAYGGAIQSGKTTVSLVCLLSLCKLWPGSRWAIVRKDLPTLRRNTLPSFESLRANAFCHPINRSTWEIDCKNGSRILFFPESIKDDPDLNRWKGLLVNGFLLEEVNELSEATLSKAIERSGTWQIPGVDKNSQPPAIIMMTCNPAMNWVKTKIYNPWRAGTLKKPWYFVQALPTDNPHLTPAYKANLLHLKVTDPVAYSRFVEGNWDVADDPTQLIKYEWIANAANVEPLSGKLGLGVDVARYGDDDTVFCPTNGNQVLPLERHHGLDLVRVAELVQAKITDQENPIDSPRVCIDANGMGSGVVDILRKAGFAVTPIDSSAKPLNDESDKPIEQRNSMFRFRNRRSQMWWNLREEFRQGLICIEKLDQRLVEDLTSVRYSIDGDKMITIESKDDIKKRIHRSPDSADALVYARATPNELGWTTANKPQRVPRHPATPSLRVDFDKWDTDKDDFRPRRSAGGLW